jgi:hypothetical protein
MHSKPRVLSRRRFLRGAGGVALGLPFLEALAARSASAQTAPLKRFAVFFACNGVNMDRWFPNGAYGALTDAHLMGTANEALLPFRSKLLFPRGVHMSPRGYSRDGGGGDDHGKGMAHKLTAQFADDSQWLARGPSIDQVLAQRINPGDGAQRQPALTLMVGRPAGYRGLDFVSYTEAGRSVAAINNPWTAYSQFIGLDNRSGPPDPAQERLTRRRESVMDLVRGQFEDLQRADLSSTDRQKLDQHFSAVRDVEVRLARSAVSCGDSPLETRANAYRDAGDRVTENLEYPTIADLQVDIMALALACDYTRVATLHFDRGSGGPIFQWEGMSHTYSHHKLSHGKTRDDCFDNSTNPNCGNVAGYEEMLFQIDSWHQRKLARLLSRLDGYTEADGRTVLDNSAILYTNELSNGRAHSFMDLPYIIAGGAAGYFKQSQYVLLGDGTNLPNDDRTAPHNRLLNTLINAMGVTSDYFGVRDERAETMQGGVYEALLA